MGDIPSWILLYLILPILLGVLGNLVTGWIRSTYTRSVFSSRKKRIEALKREYHRNKLLNEQPSLLVPFAIRDFIMNLTEFIITSAVLGILYLLITYIGNNATIRLLYGIYFLIYAGYNAYTILFKTVDLIGNSLSFSNYIVEAKEKLIKLGGNPEDLDKEETEA